MQPHGGGKGETRKTARRGSRCWNFFSRGGAHVSAPPLFRLMSADQQKVLFSNTARAMGDAPREVKIRHIGNCRKADPAYGKGVADTLGIPLSELPKGK